jgi:hypothetical protein
VAVAVEAHGAHGESPDAVQRAGIVAAVPATRILEVPSFPDQELEEFSHFRLAQRQPRAAINPDAHTAITALVLPRYNREFDPIARRHGNPLLLVRKRRTKNLRPSSFLDDGLD